MRCSKVFSFIYLLQVFINYCIVSIEGQDEAGDAARDMQQQQQLLQNNFLVGIASLGAMHEHNTQCGRELEMLLQAIDKRELWGLKVIDYFGTAPSNFAWGNYFWFRSPELCDDLNQPLKVNLAYSEPSLFNVTSPVSMDFVVVYMNFSTPYFIDFKLPFETLIHLGLCLPKSCDASLLQHYSNIYFQNHNFEIQQNFQLEMQAVEVKKPQFSWAYLQQPACILFFIITILCILLPLAAEILYKSRHKLQIQHTLYVKNHHDGKLSFHHPQFQSSLWEKLLMCFRWVDNYQAVMRLENSKGNAKFFTMMAGMRVIICLWITVFHVYYYSLFVMSNGHFIFAKLETFALQPIKQACFYVDVFFVMSSFLLVYNFLSNTKQLERIAKNSLLANIKLYVKNILQRYLRLTPVMIVTVLLGAMVMDFVNMYTPFRLGVHSGLFCKTNWWYNLLYIQNLLDMNCICCSWTWYLACEMQYYVLFITLLFLHVKHPKFAKTTFLALTLGFVVIAWICNYTNGITFQIDVIYSTLNQLYVKPWVRIMPYLGGAAMGWYMHQLKSNKEEQPPQTQTLPEEAKETKFPRSYLRTTFWLITFVLYIITNFMSYWNATPIWAVTTIMSVGKLIFSLFMGGIIVLCALDRGGLLNSLLSARVFLFLNKFCYSIYMLAPVIVFAMFGLRNEPSIFTEVGSTADFIAIVAVSIVSSIPLYLLVELPMQKVAKVLWG